MKRQKRIFKLGVRIWQPKSQNKIRILPPTWRNAIHYGYDVDFHGVHKIAVWLIDRKDKNFTPQLWLMPWYMDREIMAQCFMRRSRRIKLVDHPSAGYDISFSKVGRGVDARCVEVKVSRGPSKIMPNDEDMEAVVDFLMHNPIPGQTNLPKWRTRSLHKTNADRTKKRK